MEIFIKTKIAELDSFLKELVPNVEKQFKDLTVAAKAELSYSQKAELSNDYTRPIYLGGALCIAGLVSLTFSSRTALILGGAGAATLYYGIKKKKEQENIRPSEQTIDFNGIINQQDNLTVSILDSIQKKWFEFLSVKKAEIQKHIEDSDLSKSVKDSMMNHTYFIETLQMNNSAFRDAIYDLPQNQDFFKEVNRLRTDLLHAFIEHMYSVRDAQVQSYQNIINEMKYNHG